MRTIRQYLDLMGRAVREERERRGWSLRDLKDRTGLQRAHLSRLERGQVSCTIETLVRLAEPLEVSPMFLLCPHDRPLRELLRSPRPLWSEQQIVQYLTIGVSGAVVHQQSPNPAALQELAEALLASSDMSSANHALLETWLRQDREASRRREPPPGTGVLLE